MLTCGICGKECKTVQGLIAHRRLAHLVVSGESSGGDQSGQRSVNGGDQSGQGSGDRSAMGAGLVTGGVVGGAAVGAGLVAGDQSMGEGSGNERILRVVEGWARQYEETGEIDPQFRDFVMELVRGEIDPQFREMVMELVREEMRKRA